MILRPPVTQCGAARGDARTLLRLLPDVIAAAAFFDPQHRGVLNRLAYGNEGARQKGRCALPAMSDSYIEAACREPLKAKETWRGTPGDLVIDPAAGSFIVMHIANELGRRFIGCDLVGGVDASNAPLRSAIAIAMTAEHGGPR